MSILRLDTQHDLFGGLSGNAYIQVIQFCFSKATAFSLAKRNFSPTYPSSIEDQLSPYIIQTSEVTEWFAWKGGKATEILYRATPEAMEILLNYFDDIFMNNRKKVPKKKFEQIGKVFLYPSYLEDLCFFKKKDLFFGTLSHESICAAKPHDAMDEKTLRTLASWELLPSDWYGLEKRYI